MGVSLKPCVHASVIVSSRNRPQMLRDVVHSILSGDTVPEELIVVDQSAAANADFQNLGVPPPCTLRYVWSRSTGLARSRNEGARLARCDVLVFTDDDVIVAPDWLRSLAAALERWQPRSVVTGSLLPLDEQPGGFQVSLKTADVERMQVGRIEDDLLNPNVALYRSVFDEIGPFDERLGAGTRFPAAEDNDYCYRVLDAGYRIVYVPEAVVYHRLWRPQSEYLSLRWRYGIGQGGYYAKYCSLRDRFILRRMVRDVARKLVRAVRRFRSQRTEAIGHAVYAAGVIYGASSWFLTYKRTR